MCVILKNNKMETVRGSGILQCIWAHPQRSFCYHHDLELLLVSDKLFMQVVYSTLVLGDMLHFHIVLSSACEFADTRYYRANLFSYLFT